MLCCVIAMCLIAKIVIRWRSLAKYLGFSFRDEEDQYGYIERGELDVYGS